MRQYKLLYKSLAPRKQESFGMSAVRAGDYPGPPYAILLPRHGGSSGEFGSEHLIAIILQTGRPEDRYADLRSSIKCRLTRTTLEFAVGAFNATRTYTHGFRSGCSGVLLYSLLPGPIPDICASMNKRLCLLRDWEALVRRLQEMRQVARIRRWVFWFATCAAVTSP